VIITLGLLSGLLTTCAWLPQLLRTWRRGRADDISYTYLGIFAAGVLGWLAYGLLAAQPAVFAANVVTFTLIAALTLLKIRPRRRGDRAADELAGEIATQQRRGRVLRLLLAGPGPIRKRR
jgi:MtN3 and saliva related transmembrane protein